MAGRIGQAGSKGVEATEVAAADAVASGGAQAAEVAEGSGATSAKRTERAKSLDMGTLGLASALSAALDATAASTSAAASTTAATTAATTTPSPTADLAAKIAAMPRGPMRSDLTFALARESLKGRVTTDETRSLLSQMNGMATPEWLTFTDRLKATPSDEKGLSLLDKLVKYGVSDRNRFIADFADQVNRKLGLGLPTLEERETAHKADGMRGARAARVAGREVRAEADVILEFYNSRDRQGFLNTLRAGAEDGGTAALRALLYPLNAILPGGA